MGIIGQDRLFCLFFLGLNSSPFHSCTLQNRRRKRANKGSENKYKETRGTKEETNMGKSERALEVENISMCAVIFYSTFMEGAGALAVLLCIVNVFSFSELFRSLSLSNFL